MPKTALIRECDYAVAERFQPRTHVAKIQHAGAWYSMYIPKRVMGELQWAPGDRVGIVVRDGAMVARKLIEREHEN